MLAASRHLRVLGAQRAALFSTKKVPIAVVKQLRETTGAPLMECKKALGAEGVDGDLTLAIDWLRKHGIAKASKRKDLATESGLVVALTSGSTGVIVEVR